MPAKRKSILARAFRLALAAAAILALYLVYVYLTLPDVNYLATKNPASTAFMDLRIEEAKDAGDFERISDIQEFLEKLPPAPPPAITSTAPAAAQQPGATPPAPAVKP